jgi:hypothetical protein
MLYNYNKIRINRENIMPPLKDIRKYKYRRIDTLEMQKYLSIEDYLSFTEAVEQLAQQSIISPIKSSRLNGKRPALYNRYNILPEEKDYSAYEDELKHMLNSHLKSNYYLKHLKQYEEDRPFIIQLNIFLNIE